MRCPNPQFFLTGKLSWMNSEKEERRALRPFSPLKAPGPTHIIYETVFTFSRPSECRTALVGSAAAVDGGRDEQNGGGGVGGQLPLQSVGARQPQAASAHSYTQHNHKSTALSMPTSSQSRGRSLLLLCFKFIIRVTVPHTLCWHKQAIL